MEFTYKVTEAEYLRAWKLRIKLASRARLIKTVMFWTFILVCLLVLWVIVQRNTSRTLSESDAPAEIAAAPASQQAGSADKGMQLITNVGPFVLIAGLWITMLVRLTPIRLRRMYRKDPSMQGLFTVNITPDSISVQNTAGTSSQTGWNFYEYWREGRDIVVLVMLSSAYFIISEAGLSQIQRNELHGILTAVLPKK